MDYKEMYELSQKLLQREIDKAVALKIERDNLVEENNGLRAENEQLREELADMTDARDTVKVVLDHVRAGGRA